ncbi:MAG: HAD-IIA family hydrolase, partial [Nocardioides sp.]
MLGASLCPLVEAYDLAMFDLDGVVYIGDEAVPGAPDQLARARDSGVHLAFITNNASRAPQAVADKLTALGIEASAADVVTSAQAAAQLLLDRFGAGATIAVLGAAGLEVAVTEAGLVPAGVGDDDAVALVSGYGPDVPWRDVMRAAVRVRGGLPWVASNTDLTLPTPDGIAPGHGVMVRMLSGFAGVDPVVAGKPERPLLEETVRRVGGERPLMIGDRLDTDIEGAHRAKVDSLLVLTGVTGLAELVAATPQQRPTYLGCDLTGLFVAHGAPRPTDQGVWELGGWSVTTPDGALEVAGDGEPGDWWRAVAAAAWEHLDQ